MSVVRWKNPSNIGSSPLISSAVRTAVPKAAALPLPEQLQVIHGVGAETRRDVQTAEQEAEDEGHRPDRDARLQQLQALAHLMGEQHAGEPADQTQDHVAQGIRPRNQEAADQSHKNRGKRPDRPPQQHPVEHRGQGKGHEKEPENFRDVFRIHQAHGHPDQRQMADQAAQHQHDPAVAPTGRLQADLEHHNGRDRNDEAIQHAPERIVGEGGAR